MPSATVSNGLLHIFDYPIYAVDVVGNSSVVVAGGGGASKTGVPNRLDVVLINKGRNSHYLSVGDERNVSASVGGGRETGTEAIMSLSVMNSGGGSFITTLEGTKCVEYLASLRKTGIYLPVSDGDSLTSPAHDHMTNNECTIRQRNYKLEDTVASREPSDSQQYWELIKLREFIIPPSSVHCERIRTNGVFTASRLNWAQFTVPAGGKKVLPTCVASGRSGTAACVAVGTEKGSVFLINRHSIESLVSLLHGHMKVSAVHIDVSCGHAAGVSCLSLSSTKSTSEAMESDWPLLATICDQPDWTTLRVWRTPVQPCSGGADDGNILVLPAGSFPPYAVASCSAIADLLSPSPATTRAKTVPKAPSSDSKVATYRFKHCHFLHYNHRPTSQSDNDISLSAVHVLATTVQPLCAGRKSYSHLVIWLLPEPPSLSPQADCAADGTSPLQLSTLTKFALPQGHMPACLAVHPSQSRALIAVGTMDGRVDVYFLSPWDHKLSRVYSLENAHPIFVTALSFLPSVVSPVKPGDGGNGVVAPDSFQLVSVSVDRLLLWHPGPDYFQIACLARGLPDPRMTRRVWSRLTPTRWMCCLIPLVLFVLALLPVCVVLLDTLLFRWL